MELLWGWVVLSTPHYTIVYEMLSASSWSSHFQLRKTWLVEKVDPSCFLRFLWMECNAQIFEAHHNTNMGDLMCWAHHISSIQLEQSFPAQENWLVGKVDPSCFLRFFFGWNVMHKYLKLYFSFISKEIRY